MGLTTKQDLTTHVICTSKRNCRLCRDQGRNGIGFRAALAAQFNLPGGIQGFACPYSDDGWSLPAGASGAAAPSPVIVRQPEALRVSEQIYHERYGKCCGVEGIPACEHFSFKATKEGPIPCCAKMNKQGCALRTYLRLTESFCPLDSPRWAAVDLRPSSTKGVFP